MAGPRRGTLSIALLALASSTGTARAAEVTRVVSALDGDNRFDFSLTMSYLHTSKSAFIKREAQVTRTATDGTQINDNELIKDLQYMQTRDVLDLRADFGLFRDLGFHIDAPIVLRDDRTLSFDQSLGGGCHYPGELDPNGNPYDPSCVNETNSTILADGILPGGGQPQYGIDSMHPERSGFMSKSPTVFRGPTRAGIEYLGFGLTWAPFNQARDDTKPTWTLGADARIDVGKDMRFDPANPDANTAVGLGYHQFIFSTVVSKRFKYFDPYFGAWYNLPVPSNGSPYGGYPYATRGLIGPANSTLDPQQRAGFNFGVEQIAWEDPRASQRVTVEVRGHVEEHFFGASQSELWEPLSGHPGCSSAPTVTDLTACRPNVDYNGSGAPMAYPGVTQTEAYASFGGDAGVNIQVGKYIRFRGLFGLTVEQPHFITYANAGRDIPFDSNGNRTAGTDGRVNLADPAERNPVYRETFDNPGRRFRVEGTQIWSLFLQGSLMF